LRFLIAHMPAGDLKSLSAEFLREHVSYAYRARESAAWKETLPEEVFLNYVLPYASVNERRDRWRKDFHERFGPLVKDAKTPSAAAATLNNKIFELVKVRYSTKRPKADQSSYESIEAGLASCTGLSILLVDACRAVGVPARLVGTPLWSDGSGNHTWVEIWDDGWHFTGAAEPTGEALNRAWFVGRAAQAKRDSLPHAIYAVSYKPTPQRFPLVWKLDADFVYAVNVTDRYVKQAEPVPPGHVQLMFRVLGDDGDRRAVKLKLRDIDGATLFEGQTKDERFDANDHLTAVVPAQEQLSVELEQADRQESQTIRGDRPQLLTLEW
ncbi:MAG: transglutaminase-like domain-containing protein, partial [Pirellulales bacterium]